MRPTALLTPYPLEEPFLKIRLWLYAGDVPDEKQRPTDPRINCCTSLAGTHVLLHGVDLLARQNIVNV
ncbi:MAG: hypothetical protein ABI877_09075 [Gemmatimonadaceae bacterium]